MINAYEANRRSNEHVAANVEHWLDEIDRDIRKRCESGAKALDWDNTTLPADQKRFIADKLRDNHFDVEFTPTGFIIRW